MTGKAVVLDFDTKNEKLKNVEKKINIGTKGKTKLSNMKQLLEKNSEQLKQKISEYFESCRKILDVREAKLLNKVNIFIDKRITEIDDKLKQFQQKLDHLNAYHYCLEDKHFIDWPTSDDFDCFVAASRYDFHAEKDGLQSLLRKLGALKQTDVLVTKLESSDEDDSDVDDLCEDNIVVYEFLKASESSNKSTETESSDAASSCSVLSYNEGEEYGDEKNKIKGLDDMDDYEFLLLEPPRQQLCENSIIEVGKVSSANVNPNTNNLVTIRTFEREIMTEKLLDVLKNLKVNGTETSKVGGQIIKEEKSHKTTENKEPSLAEKLSNTIKLCPSLNQQKETLSKVHLSFKNCPLSATDIPPPQNLKISDPLCLRTERHFDHSNLISDFNSRVQIILNGNASQIQMDV